MPTTTDTFSYGSISLAYCFTKSFAESSESDPSGTDQTFTRARLTVQGILAGGIQPATSGELPADLMRRIEHDLLRKRQRLRYRLGGRTVLAVDPPPEAGVLANAPGNNQVGQRLVVDAANGPHPIAVSFPIITEGAIHVEFTVEVCFVNCPGGAAEQRGYASNRFRQTESYDTNGYCTVTTSGLLIGRSDLRTRPDQLRGAIVPPIRKGYQRESSQWTLSEDGLSLSYSLTDKEYYLGPPPPAKKASGQFIVTSNAAGAAWTGQCTVRLEAGKDVKKRDLLNLAVLIARSRLELYAMTSDRSGVRTIPALQSTYSTPLYENVVEVSFKCRLSPQKIQSADLRPGERGFAGGFSFSAFDKPMPGSPVKDQPGIAPAIRGFFNLPAMIAAEFQDPCVATAIAQSNLPVPATLQNSLPPQASNPASINVGNVLPPSDTSSNDFDPSYEFYTIAVKYIGKTGRGAFASTGTTTTRPKYQTHNPTLKMEVSWSAERIGLEPELPDPCSGDDDYLLTEIVIETDNVTESPGGQLKHTISGKYVYECLNPCAVPIIYAVPPFLVDRLKGTSTSTGLAPTGVPADTLPGASPPTTGQPASALQTTLESLQPVLQTSSTTTNPSTGNQSPTIYNRDIVWWRIKTVPASEIWCGCPNQIAELVSGGTFPPQPTP